MSQISDSCSSQSFPVDETGALSYVLRQAHTWGIFHIRRLPLHRGFPRCCTSPNNHLMLREHDFNGAMLNFDQIDPDFNVTCRFLRSLNDLEVNLIQLGEIYIYLRET